MEKTKTEKSRIEGLLTVRQVAGFFRVSVSTVRRWSAKGMLNCYHVGTRGDRRYRRQDVLYFLEKYTVDLLIYNPPEKGTARFTFKRFFHPN